VSEHAPLHSSTPSSGSAPRPDGGRPGAPRRRRSGRPVPAGAAASTTPSSNRLSSGALAGGSAAAPTPAAVPVQRATPAAAAPAADGASFADLGVPAALVASMAERGLTDPFPIQTATLPDTLAGRDVLGRGRTGSGKTLAFALPLVARLAASSSKRTPKRPRGLVLAPTRELATQIAATIDPLAAAAGLRTTVIFGGVPQGRQVTALNAGVDIVIACPGRLEDLMRQREVVMDAVEITVLDEADHMADLGFLPGVRRILDATPAGGQRMLFSATLDNGVDVLVRRFLANPLTHSVDSAESPVAAMTHHVLAVASPESKTAVVRTLASGTGRRIMFLRTKHQAKKLAKQLTASGIPAVDLHGNLSQNARQRNLAAFSSGEVKVLVATDIAARGIHVDEVELVVHVDPPTEHKAYLHRSGRTARAGSGGDVVTVMLPAEAGDVRSLMRLAKITAQPQQVTADSPAVAALIGEVAAHVEPAPVVAQQQAPARSSAPRAARSSAPSAGRGRGAGAGRGGAPTRSAGRMSTSASAGSSAPRTARPMGGSASVWSSSTDEGSSGTWKADSAPAGRRPGRSGGGRARG